MVRKQRKEKEVGHKPNPSPALLRLLSGKLPAHTKFGTKFKGKNVIIIAGEEGKKRK